MNMKYSYKDLVLSDLQRAGSTPSSMSTCFEYKWRLQKALRRCQTCQNPSMAAWYRWKFMRLKNKRCIEIYGRCEIGPGLYLGHVSGITINSSTIIGKNCNIHKGVTIGAENRGPRKGAPVIGNEVWIGVNATVVGKIHIGDDVLIAPNSYVNCDVPSHSIVYGNPCIIKPSECATESYVNQKCKL